MWIVECTRSLISGTRHHINLQLDGSAWRRRGPRRSEARRSEVPAAPEYGDPAAPLAHSFQPLRYAFLTANTSTLIIVSVSVIKH